MPHDVIDNRNEKLLDHIRRILPGSQSARFAVGYFFLSGLEAVAASWPISVISACSSGTPPTGRPSSRSPRATVAWSRFGTRLRPWATPAVLIWTWPPLPPLPISANPLPSWIRPTKPSTWSARWCVSSRRAACTCGSIRGATSTPRPTSLTTARFTTCWEPNYPARSGASLWSAPATSPWRVSPPIQSSTSWSTATPTTPS